VELTQPRQQASTLVRGFQAMASGEPHLLGRRRLDPLSVFLQKRRSCRWRPGIATRRLVTATRPVLNVWPVEESAESSRSSRLRMRWTWCSDVSIRTPHEWDAHSGTSSLSWHAARAQSTILGTTTSANVHLATARFVRCSRPLASGAAPSTEDTRLASYPGAGPRPHAGATVRPCAQLGSVAGCTRLAPSSIAPPGPRGSGDIDGAGRHDRAGAWLRSPRTARSESH
jgi:hypothetical protein